MLKSITCVILLIPIVILLHVVLLVGESIVLTAGTSGGPGQLPKFSGLNIVLFDTSGYTRTQNGETFHGLPDSHDFSKNKDVFGLYIVNYCSGLKKGDALEVDYCSHWGKELFDLHRLWKVWGVDLKEDHLIENTPRLIFIGFVTMFVATLMSTITLLFSMCSYYAMMIAVVLSFVNMVSSLTTSAICHYYAHKLVQGVAKVTNTGNGQILIQIGYSLNRSMWIGSLLIIISFISCCFLLWLKRKARVSGKTKLDSRDTAKFPFLHVVRRAAGGLLDPKKSQKGTYGKLGEGVSQIELTTPEPYSDSRSRARSQLGSGEYSRDFSRNASREREHSSETKLLHDKSEGGVERSEDIAYEPYRRAVE